MSKLTAQEIINQYLENPNGHRPTPEAPHGSTPTVPSYSNDGAEHDARTDTLIARCKATFARAAATRAGWLGLGSSMSVNPGTTYTMLSFEPPDPVVPAGDIKLGELIGHRAWRPMRDDSGHIYLHSLFLGVRWLPGLPVKGDPTKGHAGIYAYKEFNEFHELRSWDAPLIIGTVWLWGTVDEYEAGYRAQYAAIRSLDRGQDLDALRAFYRLEATNGS